jgi:protein-S-isoprenylcysteine O-methyltransferase Ste14
MKGKSMREIDIPPLWLAIFLALAWALALMVPWHPFGVVGLGGGGAVVLAGLGLMGLALAQMLLGRTTFIPRRDPSAMVTGGVFRLSRNPIYLGDAMVLAGAALWLDAPIALLLVPLFMAFIARRYIRDEEARLEAQFGAAYHAWAARVRRWL